MGCLGSIWDSEPMQKTRGCLGWVWDSLPRKILFYVVFPLGLYVFDITTDLSLAVQYYYSGDFTWFGLTLGFVLGPSIIINIYSLYIAVAYDDDEDSALIGCLTCLFAVLQLGVFPVYLNILYLLVKGKDVDKHVMIGLPIIHLVESMLECVPQLCLQLYIIILTGEQVSVLKVITMVASLLAAVKAVVTISCYYINEEDKTCSCGFVTRLILLTVWKLVELSVRVLAIGLFASAFKPWIALPIVVHWLVMTGTLIWIDEDLRGCLGMMIATVLIAVDTFSTTFSMKHKRTFWPNTVLTLLGNITMVTVWYALKAGQDWYDVSALVGVVWGSIASTGIEFIYVMVYENVHVESHLTFCCKTSPDQQDSPTPDPGTSTELGTV